MRTRYKILIVISIFVFFLFLRIILVNVCFDIVSDNQECNFWIDVFTATSFHITTSSSGNGIGEWSGTAERMEAPAFPFELKDNVNAIIIYFVVPTSIILGIYYKDKRK